MNAPAALGLEPISLAELDARAGRQTRVDRKYLVPVLLAGALLDDLEPGARVLEIDGRRRFGYRSVYFDTPELTAYLDAARRRRHRFKVRTRTYLDSGTCWMEVKTRGARGTTVKHRTPRPDDADRLSAADAAFTARALVADAALPCALDAPLDLRPTLASRFDRVTVHLPSTESRLTVDTDLVWRPLPGAVRSGAGCDLALRGLAVVETKSGATPSSADRALWRAGIRPVRISKYATGMAALDARLPATPWRRTLDRHVLPHLAALPAAS
ncbi:MAG: polyphosphate polymerase domain-containing protein [Actinomycetales bacterium]|nr:polyphosphate polymerase domain-containing protein [Actinomycetales bacterium]